MGGVLKPCPVVLTDVIPLDLSHFYLKSAVFESGWREQYLYNTRSGCNTVRHFGPQGSEDAKDTWLERGAGASRQANRPADPVGETLRSWLPLPFLVHPKAPLALGSLTPFLQGPQSLSDETEKVPVVASHPARLCTQYPQYPVSETNPLIYCPSQCPSTSAGLRETTGK